MEQPLQPGVYKQAIGVHSIEKAARFTRISVDQLDCVKGNGKLEPHVFTCTELVHFTENSLAEMIGNVMTDQTSDEPFTFIPGEPFLVSKNAKFNLIWWSACPPTNWYNTVKSNLPNLLDNFGDLGNSEPFNGKGKCGPVGFTLPFKDILEQYVRSRGTDLDKLQLKVFGTFRYSAEVMFAILVCVEGDGGLETFPKVNAGDKTEAFERISEDDQFIWKVYSTVGYSDKSKKKFDFTWDHLSFAFNCPGGTSLFVPPKLCRVITKLCHKVKPSSRPRPRGRSDYRNNKECKASQVIIEKLNKKITRSGINTEGNTEDNTIDNSGGKTGGKPGDKTGDNTRDNSRDNTRDNTGGNTGGKNGGSAGVSQ